MATQYRDAVSPAPEKIGKHAGHETAADILERQRRSVKKFQRPDAVLDRTTGASKLSVSVTMRCKASASTSSPKNASATRQAICTKERPGISRKNDSGKRSMRPGM